MRLKKVFGILLSLFTLVIVGCAGGGAGGGAIRSTGSNAQPTLVTVKVATTGTLPDGTAIGGINAAISASPSTGLTIAPSDVSASGAGTGSTLVPNTNNVSAINFALINTVGFKTGELATLTYHVAEGTFPTAADFKVAFTGSGVIDTHGKNISGIGVTIQSVTLQ